jgi:hypothetical protein
MQPFPRYIIEQVRPYSMVPDDALSLTIEQTIAAVESGRPGDLVECGTWKGGASFAMLLAQRHAFGRIVKPVWMFDSFEGMPPAQPYDGPLAVNWQSDTQGPMYFDNCRASLESVRATAEQFGFTEQDAILVPGWFDQTVPMRLPELAARGIAMLRVDCDWRDPVRFVLDKLASLVPEEGTIIIDDYFAWDGCARAVHEYLAANDLPYRIRSLPSFSCAWMVKRAARRGAL